MSLNRDQAVDLNLLERMTRIIQHRGPDDAGYFCAGWEGVASYSCTDSLPAVKAAFPPLQKDSRAWLGFGFRRLAILELGESGHQPMSDPRLGLHIVFNGEIYNYIELRAELLQQGYEFDSHSDTEVILKAYHAWGADCVRRFNGIWAFALWDQKAQSLFCSRDRFGVKPFYYCVHAHTLYIGSEIKQLLLSGVDKAFNQPMLWRSMKVNSLQVYGKATFWRGIHALEPGHNLSVSGGSIRLQRYHRLDPGSFESSDLSFAEAVEKYREHFLRALNWQLRADVEVGACLSGGLDSSAIVCAASRMTGHQLRSFSSYFAGIPELDERRWIDAVVRRSGCIAQLTSPDAHQAREWFGEATWHNDLPLGTGYAAQYGVMKLAAGSGIKVLLDGQGSDELTAGYRHALYRYLADLLRRGELLRLGKEKLALLRNRGMSQGLSALAKSLLSFFLPESRLYALEFERLRFEPFDASFTAGCKSQLKEPILARIEDLLAGKLSSFLYNMVYTSSLPTLLHWEDRMSMAASLESRVPFLDHQLVEFAFSLPSGYKIRRAQGKLVHREAMRDIVPPEIYARRDKAVFGSPFHQLWMRGDLRTAWSELFQSPEFRQRGIWNLPRINAEWQKYLRGDFSQAEMLFNVYALETWFRTCAK